MGRLGCNCGATMSNVDSPSRNLLEIYTTEEVNAALIADKDITLWDFSTLDRPFEYWYCTECHRIHKVDNSLGRCILRYKPISVSDDPVGLISVPPDWSELYVITDAELDAVTERDFNIKLKEYLPTLPRKVMLSPDQNLAIVYNSGNGAEIKRYESEPVDSE